jgi:hypothetical protein
MRQAMAESSAAHFSLPFTVKKNTSLGREKT